MVLHCCFSLSQLTYLPPPWGDCKATPMDSDFFSTYSITACRIDCETRYLVENCNCRMVHMPGRSQRSISLLDTNTIHLTFTYKHVDVTASVVVVGSAFIWSLGDKNNPERTTAFCQWLQKIRYFHTPLNRKTQLSSLCVCAVITAGIGCLFPAFNHCTASQTANWKGVWRRGNICIWSPLTRAHLSNNC